MIKVKATDMSIKNNIKITEVGRVVAPGEEFLVSESRYKTLSGNNRYRKVFVIKVEEETKNIPVIEEDTEENFEFNDTNDDVLEEEMMPDYQPKKRRRKQSE